MFDLYLNINYEGKCTQSPVTLDWILTTLTKYIKVPPLLKNKFYFIPSGEMTHVQSFTLQRQ